MSFIVQHERQRNAEANLHLAFVRLHREALDQHSIAPGSRDEDRIATLSNRDFLISISDLATSGKRRFALLTVYPQRQARYDAAGRQLHFRARFSLHVRIVSKD